MLSDQVTYHCLEISIDNEGCLFDRDISLKYNNEMASFIYYSVLTRIITTFSIKTNVINTYVNGHCIDTSPTSTRE
jgi:hypothetical protein